MLPNSQKEAWLKLRDGWATLLAESGGSYAVLIERGGPREMVKKWETDVVRWKEYGVPYKFLIGGPTAVAATMFAWGAKERWELAAIDDLSPVTLDLALNELQTTQNAIKRKKGEKEDAPRITAPPDSDPFVAVAEKVQTATKDLPGVNVVAPVNPKESIFETWATPRNALFAGLAVGGLVLLGPTIGSTLGSFTAARARK